MDIAELKTNDSRLPELPRVEYALQSVEHSPDPSAREDQPCRYPGHLGHDLVIIIYHNIKILRLTIGDSLHQVTGNCISGN